MRDVNVTFACPACEHAQRLDVSAATKALPCPNCGQEIQISPGSLEGERLRRCLVCQSPDLFVRKDFPQRVGVGLVVVALLASMIAWLQYRIYLAFGILAATALVDVLLYFSMGEALVCYRCSAAYRFVEDKEEHRPFDLSTHEKYRQEAARLSTKRST